MKFWIVIFSIFFISFIVNFFINDKQRKLLSVSLIVFITIISVFRNNIGLDYFEYERLFYNTDLSLSQIKLIEPSFILLSCLLKYFGLTSQALFAIYAIFTNIFIYLGAKYYCKDKLFSLNNFIIFWCIYFIGWWNSLTQIRQFLAVAVIFYVSKYLIESNLKRYLIGVVCAFFVHYSSVVLILLYPFRTIKINLKYFIPILLLLINLSAFGIIREGIIFFIDNIPFSVYKITAYVNNETKVLQSFIEKGGTGLGTLFYYCIFISAIVLVDKNYKFKDNLILLTTIGLVIKTVFFMFLPLARISLYFELFGFIMLANFKYEKLKTLFIVFLTLGMLIISLRHINQTPLSPKKDFSHNTNKNIEYQFKINFFETKGFNL